jgi:amidophosphoribosyltransferase
VIPRGAAWWAVYNHPDAAKLCYLALYALQHRGQESAGIAAYDGRKRINLVKGQGLVNDVFNEAILATLPGRSAIGHVRYSTTGAQPRGTTRSPCVANYRGGHLAVAHNGNLTNADELARGTGGEGARSFNPRRTASC